MIRGTSLKKSAAAMSALGAVIALSACGGGSSTPVTVGTAGARLYAAGDAIPSNAIHYFTAPLSGSSVASGSIATVSGGDIFGLAIDPSGNVVASDETKSTVTGYARPTPTTSTLYTISTGTDAPGGVAFDTAGKLYVADTTTGAVEVAVPPISSASTLTPLFTGVPSAEDICFDSAANLYLTTGMAGKIYVFAPPYTGIPTIVTTGATNVDYCAFDVTTDQLIVNTIGGAAGKVLVYNLPLTIASSPSATLTISSTSSTSVAADASGDLYIGVDTPAINVYTPPFTSASTPVFAITTVNAVNKIVFGT